MFSFDICENDVSLFKFVHEHTHLSSISLEIDDWMSLFESMENETLLPSTSRRLLGDFFTKASKKKYIIITARSSYIIRYLATYILLLCIILCVLPFITPADLFCFNSLSLESTKSMSFFVE